MSGLDVEDLIDEARLTTGFDDFGGETYRDGLTRLVDGLRSEARLSDVGRLIAPSGLLRYLTNRLAIVDWHRRYPEMGEAPITRPVVMIGMGRTGTTILFDLLGQDPATRMPRTWEVDRPCPPPETATYETDPRIAAAQAGIDLLMTHQPEFLAMHPLGAQLGQECISMTGCEFASMIFLSQYRLPTYQWWLANEADMAPAYRWHRRFLQLLQWRHPGDRWVLKSGAHQWSLPALAAEYPDAVYIQTHRDPVRVLPSLSTLFATVHRTASDAVSVPAVAADWTASTLDALDRSVAAREDGTIAADRVVDVDYRRFIADPIATIRTVYDRFGFPLTTTAEGRMRAFLAANPADKHGVYRYSLSECGLAEGEIRERSKRYCDYFEVTSEPAP
jgi:hypothetical protein